MERVYNFKQFLNEGIYIKEALGDLSDEELQDIIRKELMIYGISLGGSIISIVAFYIKLLPTVKNGVFTSTFSIPILILIIMFAVIKNGAVSRHNEVRREQILRASNTPEAIRLSTNIMEKTARLEELKQIFIKKYSNLFYSLDKPRKGNEEEFLSKFLNIYLTQGKISKFIRGAVMSEYSQIEKALEGNNDSRKELLEMKKETDEIVTFTNEHFILVFST